METNRRTIPDGINGMNSRPRILLVARHPVQYSSPIFRLMAKDPRVDIKVAYCGLQGAEAQLDPGFGVEVKWDMPLLEGYPWELIPNRSPLPGMNPAIWRII